VGALVGGKRAVRVSGFNLHPAELVNYIYVCRKFLDQLGRCADCVMPILLQPVHVDEQKSGRRVIRSGGARPLDVIHRLRPLFLHDSEIGEAEKGDDVVRGLGENLQIELLGAVRPTRCQV